MNILSNDAGNTVFASNMKLNDLMMVVGEKLNLQGHVVKDKVIHGPGNSLYISHFNGLGDIEGHVGTDGKFYVLDFGRVMPPEAPSRFTCDFP